MKWMLIVALHLVNPGGETDVKINNYPKYFDTIEECRFVRDNLVDQAKIAGTRHDFEAACFGMN